jgi:putative ABC transport system permease protein
VANLPNAATAIVASYRVPTAAAFIPRQIDATDSLSAGSPTFEFARLMSYARPLTTALAGLGLLLVVIATLAAALGLMATMNARTRDLALLRALGASRRQIATVAFAEAGFIATAALVVGGALTAGVAALCQNLLADTTGLLLEPHLGVDQVAILLGGTILVAVAAASFPALRASHTQMEELLQS